MENTGTVIKNEKDKLIIQIDAANTSGCSTCGSKGSCASAAHTPGKRFVELHQHSELKEGARVRLEMGEGRSIGLAFMLFILPLLVIIVAYALFNNTVKLSEGLSILLALGSGALVFLVVLKLEDRLMKKMQLTPMDDECPVNIQPLEH